MASAAQVANDMMAWSDYWWRRDKEAAETCSLAARTIRSWIDGCPPSPRGFSAVLECLSSTADRSGRYLGGPAFQNSLYRAAACLREMQAAQLEANGNRYMADGTGRLTAVENIPIQRKLCDELVRKEFGFAFALIDQILRFRGHVVTNLGQLDALLEQQYEVVRKGSKGNRSYTRR